MPPRAAFFQVPHPKPPTSRRGLAAARSPFGPASGSCLPPHCTPGPPRQDPACNPLHLAAGCQGSTTSTHPNLVGGCDSATKNTCDLPAHRETADTPYPDAGLELVSTVGLSLQCNRPTRAAGSSTSAFPPVHLQQPHDRAWVLSVVVDVCLSVPTTVHCERCASSLVVSQ